MQLRIGAGMRMLAHRAAAGVVALVVGSASTADAARSKPKPSDEAARTTPSVLSYSVRGEKSGAEGGAEGEFFRFDFWRRQMVKWQSGWVVQ
ncbi:hypothetical protein M885DRAFT_581128 [Pelagophyceae sp. CCMP2097]|nr:hypothetical protein M885DRAFT_581128 [Pelagophyceae sp. CCMP2097]